MRAMGMELEHEDAVPARTSGKPADQPAGRPASASSVLRAGLRSYRGAWPASVFWLGIVPTVWSGALGIGLHGMAWLGQGTRGDAVSERALLLAWSLLAVPSQIYAAMRILCRERVVPRQYLLAARRVPQILVVSLALAGPSTALEILDRAGASWLGVAPWDTIVTAVSLCSLWLFVRTVSWVPAVVGGEGIIEGFRAAWRVGRGKSFAIFISLMAVGVLIAGVGMLAWRNRAAGAIAMSLILPAQMLISVAWWHALAPPGSRICVDVEPRAVGSKGKLAARQESGAKR